MSTSNTKTKANWYKRHPQVRITRGARKRLKAMCKRYDRDPTYQLSEIVCAAYAKINGADDE